MPHLTTPPSQNTAFGIVLSRRSTCGQDGRKKQTLYLSFFIALPSVLHLHMSGIQKTRPQRPGDYRLAKMPLPDSSKMRSVVASKNAPILDNVANWSEPSSPNFSVILSAATPETLTLFSPSLYVNISAFQFNSLPNTDQWRTKLSASCSVLLDHCCRRP